MASALTARATAARGRQEEGARLTRSALHDALLQTGKLSGNSQWLHESFGLCNLLVEDKHGLADCFDYQGHVDMLMRFRASQLEMLEAQARDEPKDKRVPERYAFAFGPVGGDD